MRPVLFLFSARLEEEVGQEGISLIFFLLFFYVVINIWYMLLLI